MFLIVRQSREGLTENLSVITHVADDNELDGRGIKVSDSLITAVALKRLDKGPVSR